MPAEAASRSMNELIQLRSSLARIFSEAFPVSVSWESPQAVKYLQEINHKLNGVSSAPLKESIAQLVVIYRKSHKVVSFHDLKYVCYGVAMPMQDGWCVLGDDKLRDDLLANIDSLSESRKRFRCFQALLSSYFSFARYNEQTSKAAHSGWEILRGWLWRQRTLFQWENKADELRKSGWFAILAKNENLLTHNPCDRYGEDMLRGDNSNIEEARQGLGIPRDSWVMEETILSQMRSAASLGDTTFKSHIDQLLNVTTGQTSVEVSELIKKKATALLVSRYARCDSKPEHPALRDASVSIIGNPWLKRTAWDAWVMRTDGLPDEDARKMINGWITRRLITDFFELLSSDGKAVQRRLDYWLKYESNIDDIWFVLGTNSWGKEHYDPRYKAVKDRTDKSRWLQMTNDTNKGNNAFVMRIGNKLVVEFGVINNACFFYPAEPMPFVLAENQSISEYRLKIHNRSGIGKKLSHNGSCWEDSFDSMIANDAIKWVKQSTPRIVGDVLYSESDISHAMMPPLDISLSIEKLVADWGLKVEDKRQLGGALWVCADDSTFGISYPLKKWGFKYKAGRGWWKQ